MEATTETPNPFAPVDVWIDTDPSIGLPFREADDGFALIQAFNSPELTVRGLSISHGNVRLSKAFKIGRGLAEAFGGRAGIGARQVFAGAGGSQMRGVRTPATQALAAALSQRSLTYLALAPLTNLATLLQLHPELASQIEQVIFVGGRTAGRRVWLGGAIPYEIADANVHKDPEAVSRVLAFPLKVVLVPSELALQAPYSESDFQRLRHGDDAARFLHRRAAGWMRGWQLISPAGGGILFDCFAVLAASSPHLFTREPRGARIRSLKLRKVAWEVRQHVLLTGDAPQDAPLREVTFCFQVTPRANRLLVDRLIKNARG